MQLVEWMCGVEFGVGADENRSIPTFQVKWIFLFPSCHLLSLLRKGTLLKGVLRVFSELTLIPGHQYTDG